MDIALRAKFIADSDPTTITGNLVRKLLIVMAITELKEDAKSQQLSEDCENLLMAFSKNSIMNIIPLADELLTRYKELNNGVGIEET